MNNQELKQDLEVSWLEIIARFFLAVTFTVGFGFICAIAQGV